ncbi:DNA primase [Telmatospirillum sp.]|uniref:DNA primase n=1 Tax=Telmatospirillum sp. TaxID=2079197 RepID=UPI0028472BD0|nr:DNA primase [Telmatospirillum sp.]MDR3440639.1 DNA primase [Telmatospirillum sp.]
MAFPPSFLDEIRSHVSLASVIGRSVRLTKKGREHLGLCPFHNEKSPSFTVNEDKGFYHCFGCGAHGDVITFEMQTHHLSFPEAVERLAAEAGLDVPVQAPEERVRAKQAASLYDVMDKACAFFERELHGTVGRAGLEYLRRRGLSDETIARFRLGFSPDARTALKTALRQAGLPESLAIEAGLLIVPEGGGESYDRFRGRVMFPITDRRGRIIAFGGRILSDGQPKYLNSPDTPLFHKGSVLYGLAQAREPAAQAGTVIVCEGYMDVIALCRAGFGHAVAPLGTAITEQQIELLWRMADEPIICLDGDAAGQRAAGKAALRALPLLKPGYSLRFAAVPAPEDPDSLIAAEGPAAMQRVLDQARPLSEVLWQQELAGHAIDTPERRAALEHDLMEKVSLIADKAVQDQYRSYFRSLLWETFRPPRPAKPAFRPFGGPGRGDLLRSRGHRLVDRGADGRLPGAGRPPTLPPAWLSQERLLLLMVILHPVLLEEVAERLGNLRFKDSDLDKLRQEALKHLDGWGSLDSEDVQCHLRSCGFSQILDCLLEARAHDQSAHIKPDAPVEAARALWEDAFKLYTEKDLTAELQQAEQQAALNMSDETFGYLNALWSTKIRGGDV